MFAGKALSLTWPEAIVQGTEHNNEIKSAQKQLDAYQWSYYKAYSSFLPQLSASYSNGQSISGGTTTNSYSYGLSVSQSIFKGMANYYNLQAAAVSYDLYKANLTSAQADFYNQLRLAFIDLHIAQQNLKVQQQIRDYRSQNARMIKLFYESGKEDKGNYLNTAAQLNNAEYNVASALRQLSLARLNLSQLIEEPVTSLEGTLEVGAAPALPDLDDLTNTSPTYLMNKDQLTLAEISQQTTISEFLPTVSLSGSYQKSGSNWPPSATSKSLALNVSLPLFPGGSNFADRAIQGFLLDKARQDFAKSRKDLYFGIDQAYQNFKDAVEAYSAQQVSANASTERAKIAQQKYLNGLVSYTDWDQIQNTAVNSQGSLISANKAALYAEANWYKSYGGDMK